MKRDELPVQPEVAEYLVKYGMSGSLSDFTERQRRRMGEWIASYNERGMIFDDPLRGAAIAVERADRGSMWIVAQRAIDGLIDKCNGVNGADSIEDQVVIALMSGTDGDGKKKIKPFDHLDHHFFNYLDGSISFGYNATGFMIDEEDSRIVMHPWTRLKIVLEHPQPFDLRHGAGGIVSDRTMFCYRFVEACRLIIDAYKSIGIEPPIIW